MSDYHPLTIARINAGFMSQREFAEAIGISTTQVGNYERGSLKGKPMLSTVKKIAEVLNITEKKALKLIYDKK